MFQYHNSYKNILYPYLSFLVPQTSELLPHVTDNVVAPLTLLVHLIQHIFTLIAAPIWIKSITHKYPPEGLPLLVLPTAVTGTLNLYKPHPFFALHYTSFLPITSASTWATHSPSKRRQHVPPICHNKHSPNNLIPKRPPSSLILIQISIPIFMYNVKMTLFNCFFFFHSTK